MWNIYQPAVFHQDQYQPMQPNSVGVEHLPAYSFPPQPESLGNLISSYRLTLCMCGTLASLQFSTTTRIIRYSISPYRPIQLSIMWNTYQPAMFHCNQDWVIYQSIQSSVIGTGHFLYISLQFFTATSFIDQLIQPSSIM